MDDSKIKVFVIEDDKHYSPAMLAGVKLIT